MERLKTKEILQTIHMADTEIKVYQINDKKTAQDIIQSLIVDNLKKDKDGCYIDISKLDLLLTMIPIVTNLRIETDKAKDMLKKLYKQRQPEIMELLSIFELQVKSAKMLVEEEYNKRE